MATEPLPIPGGASEIGHIARPERGQQAAPRADRLTLARLLLMVAGVAVAFALLGPNPAELKNQSYVDQIAMMLLVLLEGLAVPAPIIIGLERYRGHRITLGQLYWLACGVGLWTILPLGVITTAGGPDRDSQICLLIALGLGSLWMAAAAVVSGDLPKRLARREPWSERMGWYLMLAFAPYGLDTLSNMYFGWSIMWH